MIIREIIYNDVPAIARVHVDTWRTAYRGIISNEYLAGLSYKKRENGWYQILNTASENRDFIYVAENQSGEIIGFANGGLERSGDSIYKGELKAIYILEDSQRKGIGRRLVQTVALKLSQENINSMLVWVLADNSACRFYEKLGGEKVYSKQLERWGAMLTEVAYGWTDTTAIIKRS
ncbi:GCN5-related N-acetyltransferase [Calothrix sp. NIES-4071]|nr:GCN5-related N-acetyltransferase [Calothrix sp. NIES-4071]BAZ57975.1 GCN5-related N-acetyltransferase [Calothrix sp. NIES-4105]